MLLIESALNFYKISFNLAVNIPFHIKIAQETANIKEIFFFLYQPIFPVYNYAII